MAPKKGGIRKRILEPEPSEPKQPRVDSKGRSKAATSSSAASSSSSATPLKGGIVGRMAKAQATAGSDDAHVDKPLNRVLKQQWGKGKVSAKDVAEIFEGAGKQGAEDVPKMSSLNHPQNLHRSLVSAFGHPVGAPAFFGRTYR